MNVVATLLVTWAAARAIDASNDECSAQQAHGREKARNCLDVPVDESALLQSKAVERHTVQTASMQPLPKEDFDHLGEGPCRGPGVQGVSKFLRKNRNLEQCEQLCLKRKGGTAMEYNRKNRDCVCHIFPIDDFKAEKGVDCYNLTTSYSDIGPGICQTASGAAKPFTSKPNLKKEECQSLCDADKLCTAYSFFFRGGQCRLHTGAITKTSGTGGFFCSVKEFGFDLIGKGTCRGPGKRGISFILKKGVGLAKCGKLCDKDRKCLGIQYKKDKKCELHQHPVDQIKHTLDADQFSCFDKVD